MPTYILFTLFSQIVAPGLPVAPRVIFGLWSPLLLFYIPALTLFTTAVFVTLRYRLWDIDIIIRRTVIYAIVAKLLAKVYGVV